MFAACFDSGMSTSANSPDTRHVKSVSEGGASVTIDSNAAKAAAHQAAARDPKNIANRRVRKTFGAIKGAFPS